MSILDLKRFSQKASSTVITRQEAPRSEGSQPDPIAMMASLAGMKLEELSESSLNESAEPRKPRRSPLDKPWQVKWLDMERVNGDVQKLADCAEEFAFAWFLRKPIRFRLIVGTVGCGKTHVSNRISGWAGRVAFERWQRTRSGESLPTVCFKTARILSPETCKADAFEEHLNQMLEASLVILDDIGTETDQFRSGIPANRLCTIMNKLTGRYLWMSSNVGPKDWRKTWDIRVEDRLLSADLLEVTAPSYRSEV